jgi:DnaJ-class molecular chaperone
MPTRSSQRRKISTFNFPAAAREVVLPVCPDCGLIGKKPGAAATTFYCTGPVGETHKRALMQDVPFVAQPPEGCESCGGSGQYWPQDESTSPEPCPVCDGSGVQPEPQAA